MFFVCISQFRYIQTVENAISFTNCNISCEFYCSGLRNICTIYIIYSPALAVKR